MSALGGFLFPRTPSSEFPLNDVNMPSVTGDVYIEAQAESTIYGFRKYLTVAMRPGRGRIIASGTRYLD